MVTPLSLKTNTIYIMHNQTGILILWVERFKIQSNVIYQSWLCFLKQSH